MEKDRRLNRRLWNERPRVCVETGRDLHKMYPIDRAAVVQIQALGLTQGRAIRRLIELDGYCG